MGNRSFVYPRLGQAPAGPARSAQPKAKTIPFDYVFKFVLTGKPGNKVQDVVEISMEGVFVALSIGYSAVRDEQKTRRTFEPAFNSSTVLQPPVLVPILAFDNSTKKVTATAALVIAAPGTQIAVVRYSPPPKETATATVDIIGTGTAAADGRADISQLSPSADTGSSLLALDKTNGLLSQVVNLGTPGGLSEPILVLPFPTTPVIGPDSSNRLPAAGDTEVTVFGMSGNSVELFLFRASDPRKVTIAPNGPFPLDQVFNNFTKTTTPIPLEPPLAAGDALLAQAIDQPGAASLPFSTYAVPRPTFSSIMLGAIADGLESVGTDLTQGFRLNPTFANLLTANVTLDSLSNDTLKRAFETGSTASEEVSFLYSIDVLGSGRELQNKAIHNIAGLGIANGDRPFRPLAKPVAFEPRSFIRIQIEERETVPATLFIVLQGYKLLGTGRLGG